MGFIEKCFWEILQTIVRVKVTDFIPCRCVFSENVRSTAVPDDYEHLLQMIFIGNDKKTLAVVKDTATGEKEEFLDEWITQLIHRLEEYTLFQKNYILVRDSPHSFLIQWNKAKEEEFKLRKEKSDGRQYRRTVSEN